MKNDITDNYDGLIPAGTRPDTADAELQELWDVTREMHSGRNVVTEDETEAALHSVRGRLNLNTTFDEENTTQQIPSRHDSSAGDKGRGRILWTSLLLAASLATVYFVYALNFAMVHVSAPAGAQATYTLPDGSEATLNSATTLSYRPGFGSSHRDLHIAGEVYLDVVAGELPFRVSTPLSEITVTGTAFLVRAWPDEDIASVMVTKGSVRFGALSETGARVELEAGERSSVSRDNTVPRLPSAFSPDAELAWIQQRYSYSNYSVDAILRDLERRFDVTITIEETDILQDTLSTYYASGVPLETILQDICTVKGLEFSQTSNGYRIY
ncbi:MAG: FecR family TonB-receptor signaling system membrane component [Bacteroidetes bacterium HLUCCA01]|nr:MAG: FecR family TonB-receptor signaling system membrane component [Bacteroidetes bacterium HLUCCA01]